MNRRALRQIYERVYGSRFSKHALKRAKIRRCGTSKVSFSTKHAHGYGLGDSQADSTFDQKITALLLQASRAPDAYLSPDSERRHISQVPTGSTCGVAAVNNILLAFDSKADIYSTEDESIKALAEHFRMDPSTDKNRIREYPPVTTAGLSEDFVTWLLTSKGLHAIKMSGSTPNCMPS